MDDFQVAYSRVRFKRSQVQILLRSHNVSAQRSSDFIVILVDDFQVPYRVRFSVGRLLRVKVLAMRSFSTNLIPFYACQPIQSMTEVMVDFFGLLVDPNEK